MPVFQGLPGKSRLAAQKGRNPLPDTPKLPPAPPKPPEAPPPPGGRRRPPQQAAAQNGPGGEWEFRALARNPRFCKGNMTLENIAMISPCHRCACNVTTGQSVSEAWDLKELNPMTLPMTAFTFELHRLTEAAGLGSALMETVEGASLPALMHET